MYMMTKPDKPHNVHIPTTDWEKLIKDSDKLKTIEAIMDMDSEELILRSFHYFAVREHTEITQPYTRADLITEILAGRFKL